MVAAVLTGQLSIGWSNDLLDVRRDRAVHRTDKPLATGELAGVAGPGGLRAGASSRPCRCRSPAASRPGWSSSLCVAAGWAYNLGLKSTVWSWVPYAVAFGGPPGLRRRSPATATVPPLWVPVAGALLGRRVRTWSTRCPTSRTTSRRASAGCRTGSAPAGPARSRPPCWWPPPLLICVAASLTRHWATWVGLLVVAALAVVAVTGRGRTPFRAAMGIALVDVALLAGSR